VTAANALLRALIEGSFTLRDSGAMIVSPGPTPRLPSVTSGG
jgi:hypothetical protein